MEQQNYWHKQSNDSPLFPSILWSRPENKQGAGKLLVIGGHEHSIGAPIKAVGETLSAGAGTVKLALPASTKKHLGSLATSEDIVFLESTPSGGISIAALNELLSLAHWADHVFLAGDFGKNSETAVVLERFIEKYKGGLTLARDSIEYFMHHPSIILNRESTVILASVAQLQRTAISNESLAPIYQKMDLLQLVESLHNFSKDLKCVIVTHHLEQIGIAQQGKVSTTKTSTLVFDDVAPKVTVACMQNPSKLFEAATTGILY